jgi:hypothetical protein
MPVSQVEQRLFKVCLTPNREIDVTIYNPAKLHQLLKALNVTGARQIYIPQNKSLAHGSIIFTTAKSRDDFLDRFEVSGISLSTIPTDHLQVKQWHPSHEREQHKVRQSLSRSRGFFCKNVPASLTREALTQNLPNTDGLEFIKIMFNEKNSNNMACFCYKSQADAAEFVIMASTGVFQITLATGKHNIEVQPFRNNQRCATNYRRSDASSMEAQYIPEPYSRLGSITDATQSTESTSDEDSVEQDTTAKMSHCIDTDIAESDSSTNHATPVVDYDISDDGHSSKLQVYDIYRPRQMYANYAN